MGYPKRSFFAFIIKVSRCSWKKYPSRGQSTWDSITETVNDFLLFISSYKKVLRNTFNFWQCVKSVRIRRFSGAHFPEFERNMEICFRIQSECGKKRTRKIPNMNTFHAVWVHFKRDICKIFDICCFKVRSN